MSISLCCDDFHVYFLIFLKQTDIATLQVNAEVVLSHWHIDKDYTSMVILLFEDSSLSLWLLSLSSGMTRN